MKAPVPTGCWGIRSSRTQFNRFLSVGCTALCFRKEVAWLSPERKRSSPRRNDAAKQKRTTMANMSDCRFQNTALDLADCEEVLEEMADSVPERLSDEELRAAQRLVTSCLHIVQLLAERGSLEFVPNMDLATVVGELNDAAD